jgi:hypothetical protein
MWEIPNVVRPVDITVQTLREPGRDQILVQLYHIMGLLYCHSTHKYYLLLIY